MERADRFNKAYEYLKNRGMVHTQKELAAKMQATAPHVSLAMKGESRYLTDNFLRRFNEAFGEIFNYQWLILGEGTMLKEEEESDEFEPSETSRFLALLEKKDEQMDRLITLLEERYGNEEAKKQKFVK